MPNSDSSDTMKKRTRGGQKTHWSEKVRVWVWYFSVKKLSGWSDYALDNEFAWTKEGKLSRDGSERPRTFEWIRKNARKPKGLDQRWHDMEGLVAEVNRHPLLKGTQAIYNVELWELLQTSMLKPSSVEIRINRILKANELIWIDPSTNEAIYSLVAKHGLKPIYDRCLLISLRLLDNFTAIALVWMLYMLNEPVNNWPIRSVLESIADKQIDDFFRNFFPKGKHLDYYTDAIETLQRARLDLSESQAVGYGYIEVIGTWPIIPKALYDSITENHLFHEFELNAYSSQTS